MLRTPAAVKGQSTIYWDRDPLDDRYLVGYAVGFLWITGYKRWVEWPVMHKAGSPIAGCLAAAAEDDESIKKGVPGL
jgi:hypothetical protein